LRRQNLNLVCLPFHHPSVPVGGKVCTLGPAGKRFARGLGESTQRGPDFGVEFDARFARLDEVILKADAAGLEERR
jgi:hypothetical protein